MYNRPVGRGGFEGNRSNPPFDLQKIASELCMLGILPFESGPLVSLLFRITAVETSLVAAIVCEFVHGRPARNARA